MWTYVESRDDIVSGELIPWIVIETKWLPNVSKVLHYRNSIVDWQTPDAMDMKRICINVKYRPLLLSQDKVWFHDKKFFMQLWNHIAPQNQVGS